LSSPLLADPQTLQRLIARVALAADSQERLDRLSAALLGTPYLASPLRGSPNEPERLVSRLDGFDCVSFAETVWALARSALPTDFEPELRALRYQDGQLRWLARNHYMSLWLARNQAAGRAERLLPERWVERGPPRQLSALGGYPSLPWQPRYLPVERFDELERQGRAGDLLCFVSLRPDLDCFHVGLLVPGRPLSLRHASRSAKEVLEEDLAGFVKRNEVPGLLAARMLVRGRES